MSLSVFVSGTSTGNWQLGRMLLATSFWRRRRCLCEEKKVCLVVWVDDTPTPGCGKQQEQQQEQQQELWILSRGTLFLR
jgi:hypothetical protein